MHIAVIGAGIAGLSCATQMQSRGHVVSVFEKSASPGGRMSTRQTELGGFDHGAQYFTARQPRFRKQAAQWQKAGWIAPWNAHLVTLDEPAVVAAGQSAQRFVAMPGMNALGQHLARELQVRFEQRVTRIEAHEDKWLLRISADTVAVEASAGPFDAVVVAVPAEQAVALLPASLAPEAARARMTPCWSLMLGFEHPLELGYDGAWVRNSRLAWIAHDASKPQRRPGEHWIAHASADWSIRHLEDASERVKEKLLKAFHLATGLHAQPVYAAVHRWRYAQAVEPLPGDCLLDEGMRIGACGDWFRAGLEGAGRVENAFLSGLALADKMAG